MRVKAEGIWTSYLIGAPMGLLAVLLVFSVPAMLTGEGLATMAMVGAYGKAILGLLFSFLIALGIAGHLAVKDIENKKPLLKTSFNYSLNVNALIWTVFVLLTIVGNHSKDLWIYLLPPPIAIVFSTIITTFSLGLLICYVIRQKLASNTV